MYKIQETQDMGVPPSEDLGINSLQGQGKNKAFIDNQWKPGQSGNPGGMVKGKSLTAVLRELLEQIPKGDTAKLKERIVKALLDKALRGDTKALDIIFDRSEGKVTLPIGGDKEKPIWMITVGSKEGRDNLERVRKGERT